MTKKSRFLRCLALFLCVQPVFWMSDVALAQSLGAQSKNSSSTDTEPPAGSEPSVTMPAPSFGVVGEHAQGDARPPELPPVDQPVDADTYVCGPGDLLTLNFWGLQNFRLAVRIDLEGRAFVPKLGNFELGGKTLAEARRQMRAAAARYYPKLGFDVTLGQARTFVVQVVNAVKKPGGYPARAIDRVAAIIARAGGFGPGASIRRVEIRRRSGEVLQADLLRYELTGDVKYDPYLLDGDVVRVPFEELAATITGAVNRPGRYELIGSKDLAELVELAGGLAPTVTRQTPLRLVRVGADDRPDLKELPFGPDGALPTVALKHEDAVHVPGYGELQQSVMVTGAIAGAPVPGAPAGGGASRLGASGAATPPDESASTRRLPFVKGDTVRTLIDRVGGLGPLADLSGSYLLRGGKALPVDLRRLVMLKDASADVPVELGDTLVIPFRRQSVLVQGAVFAPGAYPYNPGYDIDAYVALAGGPNRFGQSVKSVRVIGPDGETREYSRGLKIQPGSQLVIPERTFSSPEIVQIVISVASVLISGVAVVLAARK